MPQNITPEEQSTIDSYNKNAAAWAKGHSTQDFWKEERELFQKELPQGKILEIGSGGGRDAQKLIALGYDYTGTDASEGLLEVARKNNPGATFIPKNVYGLDFPENSFDGFWASAVLLHIPKNKLNLALENIHKVTKPNGIGFISIKQGEGEIMIEDDRREKRKMKGLFVFYSQDEFSKKLQENDFEILYTNILPTDGKTIWITYLVKIVKK